MANEPMLCPLDKTPLTMSERQGIEIDYCPTCRGVWLDRGELDKIIERGAAHAAAPTPLAASPEPRHHRESYRDHDDRRDHGHRGYPKRRKSFLEELFD
ncbi:MAG: TFIIB-type zinc ribbon-containing protein [Sphingosinicella sp.]|uniref:TFIIB-type zinc ribbon-containing protein n=1 Tax=Sphingosinicella sp. TaxID=1917971 RepID=UPI004037B40A